MKYMMCEWLHEFNDEPYLIYSEFDDQRYETRKVEIYKNGEIGYTDSTIEVGNTRLGLEPIPDLKEIASDPQFKPKEISKSDFEKIWFQAVNKQNKF